MIKNLDEDQKQQAVSMGMLMAGAAMLDPRGTGGNFGASLNKGMQAGLGTAVPLMQWMQQSNLDKDDRDYKKKQDRIQNRFRQNQQVLAEMQMKATENYHNQVLKNQDRQFGFQQQKYGDEKELLKQGRQAMTQFMTQAANGVPNPEFAAAPPPMSINQQTGQPAGMPNVPRTVPMSPQQFAAGSAMLQGGYGMPAGAFTPMANTQFQNPNYKEVMIKRAAAGDPEAIKYLETAKQYSTSMFDPIAQMMAEQMRNQK